MACPEFETRIAEWLEGQVPPSEVAAVTGHVAACPGCRVFAEQLRRLDATLSAGLERPALSPDFGRRLHARLQAEGLGEGEARRAALRSKLEREFDDGLARLRWRFRSLGSVLDVLGLGFLVAGAVTAALLQAPKLADLLPPQIQGKFDAPVVLGAVAATVVLLLAALAVCWRPRRAASFW